MKSRDIGVSAGRSIDTGEVTTADVVPVGATAIAYNLTITQTGALGFLSVAPGGTTTVQASTIIGRQAASRSRTHRSSGSTRTVGSP